MIGLALLLLSVKVMSKKDGKFPDSHACKFDKDRHRNTDFKKKN